jgi:hypothetical protein
MDVYRIGVSIVLTNSITPALTAITGQLIGANNATTLLNANLRRLGAAAAGAAAILGGVAIFKGLASLAEHGAEVNHQLELMKIAGMQNKEIQDALGASMRVSASNMTTHLSENLAHVRELRYAFGDVSVAMQHLDEISKANTILNTIRGGGKDQVWELVKSLEQKGLTFDPAAFSSYVNTMTKVVEATGGKVTPANFQSTFKYGRTSMLGWDEAFVGGALPRLIQSMSAGSGGSGGSGGPGNALMSAFAKVVQGQMPKTAAEEFDRMGLTGGGLKHIKGSSQTQIVGGIKGRDEFMANPYEWVQNTLMPALASHGVTAQNDIIAQISKMFPVRTASQIITEMGLQGRFHEGANSPFEKDIALQKGAMDQAPSFAELMKNDYPTAMKAFHAQFKNLLEVLGSPLMEPGGPVLRAISGITSALSAMASFGGAHPEGVKIAMEVLAALAGGLVIGGIVALTGALVGLVGVGGLIVGAVAGLAALAALNWEALKNIGVTIVNALKNAAEMVVAAVPGIFAAIGSAIVNALKAAVSGIAGRLGGTGGPADAEHGKSLGGAFSPMNYRSAPPARGSGGTHTAVLQVDRRTLGQVMMGEIARVGGGPIEGSVYPDSTRMALRNDTSYVT